MALNQINFAQQTRKPDQSYIQKLKITFSICKVLILSVIHIILFKKLKLGLTQCYHMCIAPAGFYAGNWPCQSKGFSIKNISIS